MTYAVVFEKAKVNAYTFRGIAWVSGCSIVVKQVNIKYPGNPYMNGVQLFLSEQF